MVKSVIEEDTAVQAIDVQEVESCVRDALRSSCLGVDPEDAVFELINLATNEVVLNWNAQLGLDPGDSDIVEEFSTDL